MLAKFRLLTPGPTPLPERVRLAMARDMIHHRKPGFKTIMARVQKGLGELFGTAQPVLSIASSGTGVMEAAVTNLFASGEKVLVVEGGKFGERWTEICRVHGVVPEVLSVPWGQGVQAAKVEAALDADASIRGVLVQLSETSTGVQHDIEALGKVMKKRDVLLVVDGISGVSISPCPMDAWGVDCLLTGSQKGLMLPPGLALIALSERAWEKAGRVPLRSFYFNLTAEKENCAKNQSHFTPAVGLLVGLDESLAMFAETGMNEIFRKQHALAVMTRAGASALGLSLFAPQDFAWGVTSVELPVGMKAGAILKVAAERFGVVMAAGQGHMKDRMIRVGHMGWVDYADIMAGLHALAESYKACGGFLGSRNYLEQAMAAYWQAMDSGCPRQGGLSG